MTTDPGTGKTRNGRARTPRQALLLGLGFCLIALSALALRVQLYGDPRLAIGTLDTPSYIEASRPPLLSWASFTGRRLFTTNILYKIISANGNCPQVVVSTPAAGREVDRRIRPCFATIALLQALLSIAAWLWLAWVVSRHLKGAPAKLLSAVLILLFGFTPQIAEWDNILGSESLSLSLFFLSFGFLIETVFELTGRNGHRSTYGKFAAILSFIFFSLWLFVRDANLYAIPVAVLFLLPLFLFKGFVSRRATAILTVSLVGLFVFGLVTSRQSPRWPPSIQHSLETFIFPFPERVQFLSGHFAMPDRGSAGYAAWFDARAPSAFSGFLLTHPRSVLESIMDNWTIFTTSYRQPYFVTSPTRTPGPALQLGEILHPGSGVIYLFDTIALIYFCIAALRRRTPSTLAWAWLSGWLYLTAAVTLFISFFGDTNGIMRHIFPSLETFRLLMWLSLLILVDAYGIGSDTNSTGGTHRAVHAEMSEQRSDQPLPAENLRASHSNLRDRAYFFLADR